MSKEMKVSKSLAVRVNFSRGHSSDPSCSTEIAQTEASSHTSQSDIPEGGEMRGCGACG